MVAFDAKLTVFEHVDYCSMTMQTVYLANMLKYLPLIEKSNIRLEKTSIATGEL